LSARRDRRHPARATTERLPRRPSWADRSHRPPRGVALRRHQVLDGPDVLTRGSFL